MSTIGCTPSRVNIYDNLHGHVSMHTKRIIADILQSPKSSISLILNDVQVQANQDDCGLFALANASALCNGIDPCTIVYTQSAMREHLCNCFHHGALTPFPNKKKRQNLGPPQIETFDIYCFCRQSDYGETMVECTACKQWFHKSCVHVPRACIRKKKKSWCCPNCKI